MVDRNSSSQPPHVRILLVDDNANGRTARRAVLEELGHRVVTAANGSDGLDEFHAHKFDMVVTDYKMPRMDGLELIAHLRKEVPTLPIVLLSGFVDTLGLSESSTGADAVIQKSANEVSHLMRAVNRLLRKRVASRKPAAAQRSDAHAKRKSV